MVNKIYIEKLFPSQRNIKILTDEDYKLDDDYYMNNDTNFPVSNQVNVTNLFLLGCIIIPREINVFNCVGNKGITRFINFAEMMNFEGSGLHDLAGSLYYISPSVAHFNCRDNNIKKVTSCRRKCHITKNPIMYNNSFCKTCAAITILPVIAYCIFSLI